MLCCSSRFNRSAAPLLRTPNHTATPHPFINLNIDINAKWQRIHAAENTASIPDSPVTDEVTSDGRFIIRPIQTEADVRSVSILLSRGFFNSTVSSFVEIQEEVLKFLTQPSTAVMLVGCLYPLDTAMLPNKKDYRIIALASLDFSSGERSNFPTLAPPDNTSYLSNIAVDPSYRRRGYARKMLAKCESLVLNRGLRDMYLHVALDDRRSQALYLSEGFTVVNKDSIFVRFTNKINPRQLMRKELVG